MNANTNLIIIRMKNRIMNVVIKQTMFSLARRMHARARDWCIIIAVCVCSICSAVFDRERNRLYK